METILSKCAKLPNKTHLHQKLTLLHSQYKQLSDEEASENDGDAYFTSILSSIERVSQYLKINQHSEL